MMLRNVIAGLTVLLALCLPAAGQVRFSENFENVGSTPPLADGPSNLTAQGWIFRNQSLSRGINFWREGDYVRDAYVAQSGARFLTTASSWDAGTRQLSVWAISPAVGGQQAGDSVSVFVRGWVHATTRVQLRYSPSGGTSTGSSWSDVGDFTVLLAETSFGPNSWTNLSGTVPGTGRLAVRVFEPQIAQYVSPIVSIDTFAVSGSVIDAPIPQPGQTVTWTAAMSPLQVRSVQTIPIGGTVLVEPGVTINVQQQAQLVVQGTFRALGTADAPITLTGAANFPPAVVVDRGTVELAHTTVTGQVRPDPGGNLVITDSVFNGPNGLIFSGLYLNTAFARIERTVFNNSELTISNHTVVLRDVTLNNSYMRLLRSYVFMEGVTSDGGGLQFSREHELQPMLIDGLVVRNVADGAALGLLHGNFFVGPNNVLEQSEYPLTLQSAGILAGSTLPASGNTNNMIHVPGGDHSGSLEWNDAGIPYYISSYYFQYGGALRIGPGTMFKMGPLSGIAADPADIRVMGTEERPVVFEQAVAGGVWYPLQLFRRIRHAVLDGAITGAAWPSALGWGFVDSSIVRNCRDFGLRGQAIVRKTLFENNGTGAFVSFPNDLLGITNPNAFEGNTTGVSAASDARYNWWGSPSGPATPSNPGGTGDPVASNVPYQPFLTERPNFDDAPPIVELEPHSFLARPGEKMILNWTARDDGTIVSQRVTMVTDGDLAQGNLIEPVIVLGENLPGTQRSIEFTVPAPGVRFFGGGNIRVEAVDDAGQIGWDDMSIYCERDEPGQLVLTGPVVPQATAGANLGSVCWSAQGINPIGGSIYAYVLAENTGTWQSLGGVTTYLSCLALDLKAPYVSTDRARIVLSLFTGGGVAQPEFYYGPVFAIRPDARVGDAAPQVAMTAPAAGASFAGGTVVPIAWTASDDEFIRAVHIQASTDGGRTWSFVVRDLPGTTTSYNWRLPPSEAGIPEVRVKVVAVDRQFQDSSSIRSITVQAGSGGCPADYNGDGAVNSQDISAYITAWLESVQSGTLDADYNHDGVVNSSDISAYITAWLAAVQNGGC